MFQSLRHLKLLKHQNVGNIRRRSAADARAGRRSDIRSKKRQEQELEQKQHAQVAAIWFLRLADGRGWVFESKEPLFQFRLAGDERARARSCSSQSLINRCRGAARLGGTEGSHRGWHSAVPCLHCLDLCSYT